jgi:phosphoadenosine phosphosulfate reductase
MAGKAGREQEFLRWPVFRRNYIAAFDRMVQQRGQRGLETQWRDGLDVFRWWMEYDELPGQIDLLEEEA